VRQVPIQLVPIGRAEAAASAAWRTDIGHLADARWDCDVSP
jgi:hypothetical protein